MFSRLPPDFDIVAAQAARDARTYVYFVEGAGLVKIGFATDPLARFCARRIVESGEFFWGCPPPPGRRRSRASAPHR